MANPALQVPYPGLPYMGTPSDALRDLPVGPADPTLAQAPVADPTIAPGGLSYRAAPAPEALSNPYAPDGAAGSFSRGIHKGIEDTKVGLKNVYGLAQLGLGYRDQAVQTFQEAKAQADKAALEGPQTASLEQARQTGDYGGYVAGLAGEALPSLATMLIPGGIGGKVGTKLAEKGAARIAEKVGAEAAERALAKGATEDAAAQAATAASTTAARRLAGTDGAKAAADIVNRAGEVAGTTVGGYPGALASSTDQLNDAAARGDDESAGKVALGSLAASAVGALPAARLLDRAGKPAVEELTQSLIPRVAKEMGTQAAVAGGAGVAQTAATLATHKWVGDNVDLLSPAAFDQYLDSLVGGGVVGGLTGGLLGLAKGAHAPDIDIRKTLRDNLDRFSRKPGEPVAPEDGTGSGPQGGSGGVSVDESPENVPNSVKAFMDAHAELKSTSAEAAAAFNKSFKHGDDGQQSVIDALHKSYDKAETKTAKQAIMKMMGKYAEDVTPQAEDTGFQARHDDALEGMARDDKVNGIVDAANKSHDDFMKGAEPLAGEAPRATNPVQMKTPIENALAAFVPRDHPIWQAAPDALKGIVKSTAKMLSTSEDLTPKDTKNIDLMRQLVGDQMVDKWKAVGPEFAKLTELSNKVSEGIETAQPHAETGIVDHTPDVQTKSLADMPRSELTDRLASVDPATPEHAELRQAFREQLKPDVVLENRSSPKAKAFFADKAEQPGVVEMAAQKTDYGPRRRLIDVNNMIGHELQKNPGSSAIVVGKVLGDLKLAGIKIKPESIKAGTWYKTKDGIEVRVSPRQAQQLRGEHGTLTDAQRQRARAQTRADIEAARNPKLEKKADAVEPKEGASFDQEAASGFETDKRAQGPRIDPPSGDVADVQASTPYVKTIKDAFKARDQAKSPAERAQIRHEAGVKIGRQELEKSETNPRTLARKLKQLEDINSGKSKEYFNRAAKGEFDSARVVETKPDSNTRKGFDPKSKLEEKQAQKTTDKPLTDAQKAEIAKQRDAAAKARADEELGTKPKVASDNTNRGQVKKLLEEATLKRAINFYKDNIRQFGNDAKFADKKAEMQKKLTKAQADLENVSAEVKRFQNANMEDADRDAHADEGIIKASEALDKGTLKGIETDVVGKRDFSANDARYDDNIANGFRDVTGSGKNDHAKETDLANALLKRLNFIGPKVKILPASASRVEVTGGRWERSGNIYIADHLHGPERIEVIAHELGHHVVMHELGEALEKATPELREALEADYNKWAAEHYGHDQVISDVLASRKPFFRGERVRENSSGATTKELPLDKFNYLYDAHEYLADQFARALTQKKESQTIIGKFFAGIAEKLRAVYDGMFGKQREALAAAPSVDKWVQSLFDRNRDNVREATGQSVPPKMAESFVRAAHAAGHPDTTPADALEANDHYVNYMLGARDRGILSRALDRRPVERQIRAAFGHDADLMKRLEDPNTRIATQFHLANKLFGEGRLDLSASALEPFLMLRNGLLRLAGLAGNNDKALQIFTDTRNGEIERAGKGNYSVDKAVEATRKTEGQRKLQESLNAANRMGRALVFDPFRRTMYGPGSNVHYSYTTALNQIGSLLKRHTGETGEDNGYLPMRVARKQQFFNQMDRALKGVDPKVLDAAREHLQSQRPLDQIPSAAERKVVASVRDVFKAAAEYGAKNGLKNLGKKDYFPVDMDKADVTKREADFRSLISDLKFEAGFRKVTGFTGSHAELIDSLYKHAAGIGDLEKGVDPLAPPSFKPLNQRLMQTIYDHGTPEQVKQLASFQNKSVADAMHNYLDGLVDKAEYTSRFGENGEKLAELFKQAKEQGAADGDIAHVRDYVAAATGAYAKDGSPIVRKLFGDKAGKFFANEKVKSAQGVLMAYQNIRTLPLSLLSAIADPMGIGVRYGGFRSVKDVSQAWKSLRDGFSAMSKGDRTGIREQADIIALAGDHVVSDMMANAYAPGAEGFARKASDVFFKLNGLNWFVKSTRYMALSAANAFLLKHAAGRDAKHSPRYLRELGVKEGDIRTGAKGLVKLLTDDERVHASPEALASDDRVRNALNRFVNESILRIDPSQHPIYYNDPAFRLVNQYQQFGHAFSDTIMDRIIHEAHYSNFHVLAPALGYIPVTAAAEMARSFIQYGPAGNPQQANWDPLDWANFAGEKAGLYGPRLAKGIGLIEGKAYAGMQHATEIGPTGQQLEDVLHTLEGQRSVSSTVLESLPAGSLIKHW